MEAGEFSPAFFIGMNGLEFNVSFQGSNVQLSMLNVSEECRNLNLKLLKRSQELTFKEVHEALKP